MQIAELIGIRSFRLTEGEIPEPGPGEIQVRIDSVGICGSDVHAYSEGGVGDSPCRYPMVLGHEPAGTVVKTGAGVTGWSAGDRAALEPAIYCYHCESCRTGHHNVCENIRFLSTPGNAGFFRQHANLPEKNVIGIPKTVSLDLATVAEPLAVALHSLLFAGLRPGDTTAVFGAGPIGLLTIGCLKLAGAGRIFVVEPVAHRRELALHMGATTVIDSGAVDRVAADPGRYGAARSRRCVRLRRQERHHQLGDTSRPQRRARRAHGYSLRDPRARRSVAHAAEGTRHLQRPPLQPRHGEGD